MKWAKERDSLIAQTKAFVNSVIAWKADNAPPPEPVQPVAIEIENPFAVRLREELEQIDAIDRLEAEEETAELAQALPMAELPSPRPASSELTSPDPASPDVAPLTPSSASDPLHKTDALQNADTLPKEDSAHNDIRKEIQSRVAAFQAHQRRFAREREAYFNSVLTKARSVLDGKSGDGDHDQPPA
jgi:hypothetical protein